MSPVPIVVCGRNSDIAKKVGTALLPECDAIHIILSVESGISDIPALLASKTPSNASDNFGSQNYSKRPLAVAVGGGFSDDMFDQMKDACKDVPEPVWLRVDTSKMEGPPAPGMAETYGAAIADRLKKRVKELGIGKEGGASEGVYFF